MTNDPAWAVGGEPVYKRDGWVCQYCDLDGKASFGAWQSLSWDHLLPRGHHQREIIDFIVTACGPCNTMLSRYAPAEPLPVGDLDPAARSGLVAARRAFLAPRLAERQTYWRSVVAAAASTVSNREHR